jgi:hypothetical protein
MSVTARQNKILVTEDWKKIYQSFKNADFQSYDFENLRRTMIDYLRTNYPEDFNDYIESSEYLALIDLIAFLGQSIAFRVDLNARDNFLELAERREAILRLARTISYNSRRNSAAQGLLKFSTISTTESVIDSNGRNLAGQFITWNDSSNDSWYDQFIKVMNAAFPATQQFGKPSDKRVIYSIPTEQYRFQSINVGVPIYGFTKTVSGRSMNFEITSTTFKDQDFIYEESPSSGNTLACVYRDDGRGAASPSSGFFLNFVQGTLNQGTFTINQPSTNESVDIDAININNTDVWLYRLDTSGNEAEQWTSVSNFEANNIIYNSLNKNIRNIFSVITKAGDRVSLQFSDGLFGNLPLGDFKTYYRVSNGLEYTINPQDIRSVALTIPYTSNTGQVETLSITLSLTSSISNASSTETNASIKANAPATYYTQNRMITGEDYNISPLSVNSQVVKIKSLNRISSGISRYFDLADPTGKYSSVMLFADDGVIYSEEYTSKIRFSYNSKTDIEGIIYNQIFEILRSESLKNYYYLKFNKYIILSLTVKWNRQTEDSTASSGSIIDEAGIIRKVGSSYTDNDLKYFTPGALVKFECATGFYFDTLNNNIIKQNASSEIIEGAVTSLWAEVVSVYDDGTATGTGVLSSGYGPIVLNKNIPSNAIITQLIPKWKTTIDSSVITTMVDLIFANKPFGLRYSAELQNWRIIFESNLNLYTNFNLGKQGDLSNTQQDSSWLILFTTDNEYYTVRSRNQRYIFESDNQIQFYCDESNKIYDSKTNSIVKDLINVLSINTVPSSINSFTIDQKWDVVSSYYGIDGYIDPKKIVISFADSDDNGVVDNPDLFTDIVTPYVEKFATGVFASNAIIVDTSAGLVVGMSVSGTGVGINARILGISTIVVDNDVKTQVILSKNNTSNVDTKVKFELITYIIQEKYNISVGQEDYRYVSNNNKVVIIETDPGVSINSIPSEYKNNGQHFYFVDTKVVKKINGTSLEPSLNYKVYVGRDNLKFQYVHSADYESRIDPSATNIIDVYILTKTYDIQFRQYVVGSLTDKPLPMSTDELYNLVSKDLNLIKSISDEIVYHPVSYKILFGAMADENLQAVFQIVKNPNQVISDNDIKSRVVTAINQFFTLENWDFGDTFYFTELSTYIMTQLIPYIASVVIVPRKSGLTFGNLFEIKSASDELFISGATVDDIEIVTGLTPSSLKAIQSDELGSSVFSQQKVLSSTYGVSNG